MNFRRTKTFSLSQRLKNPLRKLPQYKASSPSPSLSHTYLSSPFFKDGESKPNTLILFAFLNITLQKYVL